MSNQLPENWVHEDRMMVYNLDTIFTVVLKAYYDPEKWNYESVLTTAEKLFMYGALQDLDERVIGIRLELSGLILIWKQED